MRSLSVLAACSLAAAAAAQPPPNNPIGPDNGDGAQRVDHVMGIAVSDASLTPPAKERRLMPDPRLVGPDSVVVMSPAMNVVHARLAMKPSARWADSDVLDGTEQQVGGCDRVLMGLFFTSSAGKSDVLEWRYSRFDALNLLTEYGVGDGVHQARWGPANTAALDLERTVPFTVRAGASAEVDCAFDSEDTAFCIVVYATGANQAVHEVYRSASGGPLSFRTANTSDEPLHLLITSWTKRAKWQQNRIMNTSTDIRVRGLKYYEFDFDGWNTVEEVAARIIVRLRKEH